MKRLSLFPKAVRKKAGFQLKKVQLGGVPADFKPLPSMGPGVYEIRIWETGDTYRLIYVARFEEAVYVLHAFQKKTEATSKQDAALIGQRYEELRRIRERL